MPIGRAELNAALLAAHDAGDTKELSRLYSEAASQSEREHDIEAACFFLTQAYVFALEAGLPTAREMNLRLAQYGRDVAQMDLMS